MEIQMKNAVHTIKQLRPATIIAILALFVAVGGTATAASGLINGKNIKISRLARGIPVGVDLEYADQITLGRALEGRTAL